MIYIIYTVYSAFLFSLTSFNNALKLSFGAHVLYLSFMISVELPVNNIFIIYLIVQVTHIIIQKM